MADRRKNGQRNGSDEGDSRIVSLNFKVSAGFRRELKLFAARRDSTMVQVLYDGYQALLESEGGAAE